MTLRGRSNYFQFEYADEKRR